MWGMLASIWQVTKAAFVTGSEIKLDGGISAM